MSTGGAALSSAASAFSDVLTPTQAPVHTGALTPLMWNGYDLGLYGLSGLLLLFVVMVFGGLTVYVNLQDNARSTAPGSKRDPNLPEPTEIVSLRIYPIKSCRGIEVSKVRLRRSGLDLDRNWMLVNATGREFQTIREQSKMTLIGTQIDYPKDELTITVPDNDDPITLPAHPDKEWLKANCTLTKVIIWGDESDGWEYSAELNAPFTKFMGKEVRLVYKGPTPRMSGGNGSKELYGEEVPHNFADVLSVLVASETSLSDLNRRLQEKGEDPLTVERFRPNIIVKGNLPWEEDSWKRIRISTMFHELERLYKIDLDVVARCARCRVPNVNPDSAEQHAKEPWNTLMSFRRVDDGGAAKYKPCFGMLSLPKSEGQIRVGSKLEVLELTENHKYNTAAFADL